MLLLVFAFADHRQHQAYGGVKESGLGREGLRAAIEDMSEPRVMIRRRTAANENTAKS
jgi:acyl-CoA reductase-like NAD-dependent aldehyde dehydrogenase